MGAIGVGIWVADGLVSHWYVNSEAATLLTGRTFAKMSPRQVQV